MTTVLGVSASLRNARFGHGSEALCQDLQRIGSVDELRNYLVRQVRIRAEDFVEAGRRDKLPFSTIYRNLLRAREERGLSNSEAVLAAGLWGALQGGATILHCGLGKHFPARGSRRDLVGLRRKVLSSDAILLSGPVYFGDRGSLAQEFIEFLREDPECSAHVRDRLYGGIAVGAKRNGGQETTLIYQLVDMTNLNMLAVGNDSETTAQYGGTAVAGDVGTVAGDTEGIDTSIGTGRRLAHVGRILSVGASSDGLRDVRIAVWLLQDDLDHRGRELVSRLCAEVQARVAGVHFELHDFTDATIYRCIACDVCPTEVGPRDQYRCIIASGDDLFRQRHREIIDTDAVLVAAYSPVDRGRVRSVYQRFIERTRYLRRDDYVFGDMLVSPLVLSEVNSNQNLHIRMLTSMIRHQTVLHHPLIGMEHERRILNWDSLVAQGVSFATNAARLAAGRAGAGDELAGARYHPVGYVISMEKATRDWTEGKTRRDAERRASEDGRSARS